MYALGIVGHIVEAERQIHDERQGRDDTQPGIPRGVTGAGCLWIHSQRTLRISPSQQETKKFLNEVLDVAPSRIMLLGPQDSLRGQCLPRRSQCGLSCGLISKSELQRR